MQRITTVKGRRAWVQRAIAKAAAMELKYATDRAGARSCFHARAEAIAATPTRIRAAASGRSTLKVSVSSQSIGARIAAEVQANTVLSNHRSRGVRAAHTSQMTA